MVASASLLGFKRRPWTLSGPSSTRRDGKEEIPPASFVGPRSLYLSAFISLSDSRLEMFYLQASKSITTQVLFTWPWFWSSAFKLEHLEMIPSGFFRPDKEVPYNQMAKTQQKFCVQAELFLCKRPFRQSVAFFLLLLNLSDNRLTQFFSIK